ncbi:MAG: hypothetical protein AAB433_20685, partial [Nitrospirota bacterium]
LQPAVYKTAALPIELRQLHNDLNELQFYRLSALGSSVPGVFSWRYFPSLLAAWVRFLLSDLIESLPHLRGRMAYNLHGCRCVNSSSP